MKIVLGTHYFYPHIGGIESVAESHAKLLSDMGHDVTVISSDVEAASMRSFRDGYKIQRYRTWNPAEQFDVPYPLPNPVDARRRLKRMFKDSDIDLVHVHGINYLTTSVILWYTPADCPVIMHQHTPFVEYPFPLQLIEQINDRTIGRWNLRQADMVLCVSQEIERYVQELESDADTEILTNGVDTEYFHPRRAEGAKSFHCDANTPVFFALSRMSQKKGMDVLLKTAQNLDQEHVDVHFAIAGDGPMREEVEDKAKESSNMEVLGELSDEALAGYYAAADCFVFTSKSGEAFPTLTIIEALASGTPVVASRLAPDPVGIEEGKNSILVEPGDPEELTEAIKELVTESDRLSKMGIQARQTAEEHFSIESRVDQLEAYYKSIVSTGG